MRVHITTFTKALSYSVIYHIFCGNQGRYLHTTLKNIRIQLLGSMVSAFEGVTGAAENHIQNCIQNLKKAEAAFQRFIKTTKEESSKKQSEKQIISAPEYIPFIPVEGPYLPEGPNEESK